MKKNKPLISMKFLVILLIISVIALVCYINFEYCCFDIRDEECMRKWDIYGNVQFGVSIDI